MSHHNGSSRRRRPKNEKSPAYQWYPKDVLSSARVRAMSNEVEGIYRRLLDHAWLDNGLPANLDEIVPLCRVESRDKFEQIWMQLNPLFPPGPDGKRRNPRQEQERAKQRKNSRVRKLAAKARWGKMQSICNANAYANALHLVCLPIAFALAGTDQDQKQKISALPRAQPARMRLSVWEVRRHLLAATHALLDSGGPYVDAHGEPNLDELSEELKLIAARDLQAEWTSPRELQSIIDAAIGRRASLAAASRAQARFVAREHRTLKKLRGRY